MQFVHAVLSLHIAQNSQISQTSQTVRSGFDQFVLWYGNLPQLAQTAITVVVGAIVSYLVFKIVARLVKGLVTAVIAAILAFLISTVPGNLLLSSAFDAFSRKSPRICRPASRTSWAECVVCFVTRHIVDFGDMTR